MERAITAAPTAPVRRRELLFIGVLPSGLGGLQMWFGAGSATDWSIRMPDQREASAARLNGR
jgi:hypothetical protein